MTNFKFNNNGFGLTQVAQGYVVDNKADKKFARVYVTTHNLQTVVIRVYDIGEFGLVWDRPYRWGFLAMEQVKSTVKGNKKVITVDFKFDINALLSLGYGNISWGIDKALTDMLKIHFYTK